MGITLNGAWQKGSYYTALGKAVQSFFSFYVWVTHIGNIPVCSKHLSCVHMHFYSPKISAYGTNKTSSNVAPQKMCICNLMNALIFFAFCENKKGDLGIHMPQQQREGKKEILLAYA